MNIEKFTVFGLSGGIFGYYIPYFSKVICKYKTCEKLDEYVTNGGRWQTILPFVLCILNASVWALAGDRTSRLIPAALNSLLFTLCILTALIDLQIRIIPNELVLAMLLLGLGLHLSDSGVASLPGAALSLIGMMVLFTAAAAFVGFGKVGAGDVKLAGAMGFALAYPGILNALLLMCGALIVYIGLGLALRKLTMRTMLPFAPFMMFGMAAQMALQFVYPQLMLFT